MKHIQNGQKVNVRVHLAGLWTVIIFIYIYIDYFHLYSLGTITDIIGGRIFEFKKIV
mgnify:CR=1 FL=1